MKHPANRVVSYMVFALVLFLAVSFTVERLSADYCAAADSSECEHWVDLQVAFMAVVITLLTTAVLVVAGEVLARRRTAC